MAISIYFFTNKLTLGYKFMEMYNEIIIDKPSFKWQKNKSPNLTGTIDSYHPANKTNRKKMYINKKNKNSVWKPD